MKKNNILFLICVIIFNAQISAGTFLYEAGQSSKTSADTLDTKTVSVKDTSVHKIKKEILLPIRFHALSEVRMPNSVLSKAKLETMDYRTTADYFTNVPFGFINDFGSIGMPNETYIYGSGNSSFMYDGVAIDNRLNNSLDLNLFESESIDSAEVITLPRGFLYSSLNNGASVNMIPRDPDIHRPYSRLRYNQGPSSEALLDAIFSFNPFNRVNAYAEISNNSANPNYLNSGYSNWSGTGRLRYLLSKDINITTSYRYSKSVVGLNGGVKVDSIFQAYGPSQLDAYLYNNLSAPVRYDNRYQKSTINDFRMRMLAYLSDNSFTDLTLYYESSLNEFRQNEALTVDQSIIKRIINDNASKSFGANLRQDYKFESIKLSSLTNLEKSIYNSPLLDGETTKSSFSEAVTVSSDIFGNSIKPALFGKYLNYSDKSYLGFGGDLTLQLSPSINLYAGISSTLVPYNIWEERLVIPSLILDSQKRTAGELTLAYADKWTNASVGYFHKSSSNVLLSTTYIGLAAEEKTQFFAMEDLTLSGFNVKFDHKIWKLVFSTNTSFYFPSGNRKNYKLPDYTSSGGIYYVDTLFSRNLHLKAGLNYYSTGKRDFIYYDFERGLSSCYNFIPSTPSDIIQPPLSSTFQIDFFLAGRIHNSATVYFVYQNLLNAQYYIIPYYPKQAGGIRFGVAWEFLD